MLKSSLLSISLRGITLASKFLLVLFMARFFTPEELGIYGLMTVSIMIGLYVLGMDFNAYNARELLARKEEERAALIRDQLVFHAGVYVVVLPLLLFVFAAGVLPREYMAWFYLLLVLEHLSQEADRLFMTLSRPVTVNLVLFFRLGAWAYVVIAVGFLVTEARDLTLIWQGWTLGVSISLILSAFALRDLHWRQALRTPVDWKWIGRGVRTSLVLLCATLATRGTDYADRYFIQFFRGEAMVGVYTFYAQLANVVQTFIYTGVIMIFYPKLISAHQEENPALFRSLIRKMSAAIVGGSLLLAIAVALGIYPVLFLVGKPVFFEHLAAYWVFLVAVVVFLIAMIPHLELYVKGRDRAILGSSLIALAVALVMNALLVPDHGILGAAIGTLIAALTLAIVKFGFNLKA